ncbi:ABC transporter permease [Streptacidiphilus jiangxiensis]|uniref:ABC-2 type transport system permease protein n=1 Tax=Streptacidiphilus jiangxiensis TaxID=235985 RepID=A0A1H7V6W0_STRJI|nr:ABC transporter permease [Streptacidiphilus jiangxiensis]SEM04933.1 ABC-2 type transport system permease protein [Streptacidiphilus jiangxiensis]
MSTNQPVETAEPDSGAAVGFRPSRTLPLRVEARRQLSRRRTFVVFGVMVALPVIVWLALAVGGTPSGRDGSPSLIQAATSSGVNFAFAVLFMASGFLLSVPVALFFGDTIASEASWSSLRYLLAAPVPRARLLVSKLAVALGFSAVAVLVLPLVALGVGTAAYGSGELHLTLAGSLTTGTATVRLALVALYLFVCQLSIAGFALWLSTLTDAPLGAVGGAVGLAILSGILDNITALGSLRDFLPTHGMYAWVDVLQTDPDWTGMVEGLSLAVSLALVFGALAFRHFQAKDVVS